MCHPTGCAWAGESGEHLELGCDVGFLGHRIVDIQAVLAGIATAAVIGGSVLHEAEQAVEREIGEGVDPEECPDIFDRAAGGDELRTVGEVDAEVAGVPDRRAGDP